jgi:hypothetical protein
MRASQNVISPAISRFQPTISFENAGVERRFDEYQSGGSPFRQVITVPWSALAQA